MKPTLPPFIPTQMRCTLNDDDGDQIEITVLPEIAEDLYPIQMKLLQGSTWEFNRYRARELAAALIAAANLYEAHNPNGEDK